jgi:hypothetical protein
MSRSRCCCPRSPAIRIAWRGSAREAQVLASLNHPNIAHIYGIEEASGVSALVMELQHWHYDTFRGGFGTYGDRLVTLAMGNDGKPSRASVEFIGEFERVG